MAGASSGGRAWACVAAARRQRVDRVPFGVLDGGAMRPVGSVARAHLPLLRAWPGVLQVGDDGVVLTVEPGRRDAALAPIHAALRDAGAIRAWRDESFPLYAADGRILGHIERAAARFWGSLTLGAHCNGFVADASDRPTHLWIAQRAFDKATDPGAFDNLIGGGVPEAQSPRETLLREAWEEAGLRGPVLDALRTGRVLRLQRDIPEGLQHEWLHTFDLALPPGLQPQNQDGEVDNFRCLPLDEALDLAAGESMTADAALTTLDFALRHRLLDGEGWVEAALGALVAKGAEG